MQVKNDADTVQDLKVKKAWQRLAVVVIIATTLGILMALGGCSLLQDSKVEEVKTQGYSVTFTGIVPADSSKTYGDQIEKYAPGGKWSSGKSTSGVGLVEYEGEAADGDILIQWVEGDDGWSVGAMELNGSSLSYIFIGTWFSQP